MYKKCMIVIILGISTNLSACLDRVFAIKKVTYGHTWDGEELYTGYLHHSFLYAWREDRSFGLAIDFMDDKGAWISENKEAARKYFKIMEYIYRNNRKKEAKG